MPAGKKRLSEHAMRRNISQFTEQEYDLLVVGGGINGAAIAHMAALNGFKVALLEKGDFASGTSSKTTKLIHGGLRYLENFEFGLVRESLRERSIQLKNAPHLVKPLGFIIPLYKKGFKPVWLLKWGVWLYDFLSGKYLIKSHQILSKEDVLGQAPFLKQEGLLGGIMYFDAQMDDARLCLENVLSAAQRGADVANYVEVKSLMKENGKAVGVVARDSLTGNILEIKAKKIVCAVGPWTNKLCRGTECCAPTVRATKGVHIIYKEQFAPCALFIPTRKDKRVFFVIPWMGHSLIGTTDTDFSGDPDKVSVEKEDIDYLFEEMKRVFPKNLLQREKIFYSFAGLRPLVFETGSPSKVSRKHLIEESSSGVVYVMGGKYTTYRKIAEDCLRLVTSKRLFDTRRSFPLYGSGEIQETPEAVSQKYHLSVETIQYLTRLYGVKYKDVLALVENDPSLGQPLCPCSPAIRAQVVYAIKTEMACAQEDIFDRRLGLVYSFCESKQCFSEIKRIMASFI